MKAINPKKSFLKVNISKATIVMTGIMVVVYTLFVTIFAPSGNIVLFALLLVAQYFFTWQALNYLYTIWNTDYKPYKNSKYTPGVDVFITVCGEPKEIVEETLKAVIAMDYPNFKTYILNDGLVAKKDNWEEMEQLAKQYAEYNVFCITREIPGGFKAGNINNALKNSSNQFVAVFDADHVPHKDFLRKMMPYFANEKVGFVQSPQYYKNFETNFITKGAWEQQELFFGPIMKGKNRLNSTFMCGTNMVLRREALLEAGGMCEHNIAEDFLTSLFIHKNGWKSIYVPEVLAEGLAPEDFLSYYKQQFRWTRGSLEVVFKYNPLFMKGLSISQRIQYLGSAGYYISGLIILINLAFPLVYFFTGLVPLQISTMALTMVFIPYILFNLLTLQASSNYSYTFNALAFSVSSFFLQIRGIWAVLTKEKTSFAVTSKQQLAGNFLYLAKPHLIYLMLVLLGIFVAYQRDGIDAALVTNITWAFLYILTFSPFVYASMPKLNLKPNLKFKLRRKDNLELNLNHEEI